MATDPTESAMILGGALKELKGESGAHWGRLIWLTPRTNLGGLVLMVGAPGGGPGGWFGNWIGWGRGTRTRDLIEAKPLAADLETKAGIGQRPEDFKRALSDPVVAKMVKHENIVRIALYISGIVIVFFLFFLAFTWLG